MKVSTRVSFEVEIKVEGTFSPGTPAWGGSRMEPPINPPEPDSMEDVEIEDIGILVRDTSAQRTGLGTIFYDEWRTVSIMDGVDPKSADIQKLFANIATLQAEVINEELLGEAQGGE